MKPSVTRRGLGVMRSIGLLTGLAVGALLLATGPSGGSVRGQSASPPSSPPPSSPPPTERIDVEQAVSFPYDI